ncbi:FUSC family protein [Streptacidiphilus sp. ASG 303]|uniref:FUSC family protein n=1 Tax=Streptacidiphilus sp. ASG 303 TaxID=2896847 RepID=UPI001E47430E|nr:FUSC family protein [Streptacidiphilus sp. ASG 303]MCD0486382.1 FUSC family protein [Streptacidiphilus sp. ASG 303]
MDPLMDPLRSALSTTPARWLRTRDPDLAATRRAARTAVVMPVLLVLCQVVVRSPAVATFASFGSFSMLLLVDFPGSRVQQLRAYSGFAAAWAVLICLGTLTARPTWLAVGATVVVGFLVLFSGVVSSVLAGATNALLLGFVLPVTSPAPPADLPGRLAGVGLALSAALPAVWFLWPRRATEPLSTPAARTCRAVAALLRADASRVGGDGDAPTAHAWDAMTADVLAAWTDLRAAFDATPYRPAGLSTGSRAIVRLVDELTWISAIATRSGRVFRDAPACDPVAHVALERTASVLDLAAGLLENLRSDPAALKTASTGLRRALDALERGAASRIPVHRRPGSDPEVHSFLEALDVSFRTQEMGFAALQVADNVHLAARAEQRSWRERLAGRDPGSPGAPLSTARERAVAHLRPHSVWLHNSLRGAFGLGIAVVVANLTGLQHSFWVLLGTLSVLRSNALSTGQSAARALAGTLAGSLIGAGLLVLVGPHGTLLWLLLPLAVLVAGTAPTVISFAAGQAAFTVTLVVLFSIGRPSDWHIALVRAEDIALGCAVSVLVGLVFWPRGAAAAVDRALAVAYADSARYLAGAVDYAVGRCGAGSATPETPARMGRQAAAAARRLDDAFRSYLAERGPKPTSLADITTLVTGVVGLRLAGDAVLELWQRAGPQPDGSTGADARHVLLGTSGRVAGW